MPRVHQGLMTAMDTLVYIAEEVGWIFSRKGTLAGLGHTAQTWKAMEAERAYWAKRRDVRERIAYLKKQKIMENRSIGARFEVKLTNKGFCCLLKEMIKRAPEFSTEAICIIIFDIPESERALRLLFRRLLKACGFRKIQKSVWFTHKTVGELLRELIEKQKLHKWIRVIEGKVL